MTGREKYGEGTEQLMIQSTPDYLSNTMEGVLWPGPKIAANGTGSLVFIDNVTADSINEMI